MTPTSAHAPEPPRFFSKDDLPVIHGDTTSVLDA